MLAPPVANVLHRMWIVFLDVSVRSYFDLSLIGPIAASETHFEVHFPDCKSVHGFAILQYFQIHSNFSKILKIMKFQLSRRSILWLKCHHCQYEKCLWRPQIGFPPAHPSIQAICSRWQKIEIWWFSKNAENRQYQQKSRFFGIFSKISKILKNPYSERIRNWIAVISYIYHFSGECDARNIKPDYPFSGFTNQHDWNCFRS